MAHLRHFWALLLQTVQTEGLQAPSDIFYERAAVWFRPKPEKLVENRRRLRRASPFPGKPSQTAFTLSSQEGHQTGDGRRNRPGGEALDSLRREAAVAQRADVQQQVCAEAGDAREGADQLRG